ncbi:MAG: MG2 domain-containing protein [Deinococcus sp.]|uniref:MG2 domain-containing protein n=1 Tax=Deinococcus sp. TaxID=47478 RepID=UPI0026DB9A6B|nr:MG2 domain-containing protein [Deinococcus sp.]MDO4246928.1 MG2 domain-containing protein [Deinococcus sp.]
MLLPASLFLSVLLGSADAASTAAPTPLFTTPALSGKAALTLPAGKPLGVVDSLNGRVATVIYGGQLYCTRRGLLRESSSGASFLGEGQWFLPPQTASEALRLPLSWSGQGALPRDWQVQVLPLREPEPGQDGGVRLAGTPVRTVAASLKPASSEEGKLTVGRTQLDLGKLRPGLYLLTASRRDAPATVLGTQVVRVTDLHLVSIATPNRGQLWATHAQTGAVLPGVRISGLAVTRHWSETGEETVSTRPLAPVTTDARGLASFSLRDGERLIAAAQATIGGQTHSARIGSLDNETWNGQAERALALIQTDKPVYRPGETLRGLALACSLTPGQRRPYRGEVTVRLSSGYPRVTLAQQKLRTDADGLVRFSFPLPAAVKTGSYSVEVEMPASPTPTNPRPTPDVSSVPVEVRAFVKPLFTLTLSGAKEIVAGQTWTLGAAGELYQGGAANVAGEVFVTGGEAEDYPLYQNDFGDEDLGGYAPYIDPKRRPNQTFKLSAGRAALPLKLGAAGQWPASYTVSLRARDEYGRDVWASRAVRVYPANVKFAAPTRQWREGESRVGAQLREVGTQKPLAGRKVRVEARRSFSVKEGGNYASREEVLFEKTLTTDAQGRFSLTVPLDRDKEGEYFLRVFAADSAGRTAQARLDAGYVYHARGEPQQRYELELQADRETYAPGAAAQLTLRTTLPAGTPVLLSAHAEERGEQRLIRVTGPKMTVRWPLTPALEPAFTVQALAVQKGEFVRGTTDLLTVPREDKKLQVKVSGGAEVRPGEKATFTVSTLRGGRGVPALVTLAAVNESVYAIADDPTPEPWELLWSGHYPQVEVRSSQNGPDDGRGGGGGDDSSALYRSDLREVAAFQTVQTDAAGQARVTVTMPEALGAYRLSARALTRDGSAGEARGEQRVGLPFAVRLIRPRVLTAGDTGSAVVGAVDRQGRGGSVTLSLGTGQSSKAQTRTLPLQGGSASTTFSVQAPAGVSALTLRASATRGQQRDGVQETLPVRPAGQRQLISGGGTLKGEAEVPLKWPAGTQPESLVIDLAASPLQLALSGLGAALSDPTDRWQTTDALSARLRSNLDLAALAARFGWPEVRERALGQARRDLTELLALRGDGGWGWTAQSRVNAEMTAAALSALVQAKGAGLTDSRTLQNVRDQAAKLDAASPALAAALAEAGVPERAVRLARSGVADPAEAARLASVLAPIHPDLAATLYARARAAARTDKGGALVLSRAQSGESDTEPTAWLLEAAARLGRRADLPALTRAVLERRVGDSWGAPRPTAAAVSALRVLAEREGPPVARTVTAELGAFRKTVKVAGPTRLVVPAANVKPGTLRLSAAQPTPYAWALQVRRAGAGATAPSPVKIERHYDATTVERDGIVTVTLTLTAPSRLSHLRVTDPIPGGLEAADDRPLGEGRVVNAPGSNATVWAERALYDDRAVFYLEDVKAGKTTLRYRLRALASGTYVAPAPRVDFAGGAPAAEGAAQTVKVR